MTDRDRPIRLDSMPWWLALGVNPSRVGLAERERLGPIPDVFMSAMAGMDRRRPLHPHEAAGLAAFMREKGWTK